MIPEDDQNTDNKWIMSNEEVLKLHQLQTKQYWADQREKFKKEEAEERAPDAPDSTQTMPENWCLTKDIKLYDW